MALLKMTEAERIKSLEEQVAKYQAQETRLLEAQKAKVRFRVSPKGCVQMLGTRKFGITLYQNEWAAILERQKDIVAFIEANKAVLSVKA